FDPGQQGSEIRLAFGEGLGAGDIDAFILQRLPENVVAGYGEIVVVAVQDRHATDVQLFFRRPDGGGNHVGFRQGVAEHVLADVGDAVGGGGDAHDRHPGVVGVGAGRKHV